MPSQARSHTKTVVMTFGTFDHFHAGHESYLKQAASLGTFLVCVIARDETVKKIKGRLPDFSERKRRKMVEASGIVHKAVLGNADDKYEVVRKFRPDIIALGYDQFTFTFGLQKLFIDEKMDTKIVRMQPYEPHIYKSSLVRLTSPA